MFCPIPNITIGRKYNNPLKSSIYLTVAMREMAPNWQLSDQPLLNLLLKKETISTTEWQLAHKSIEQPCYVKNCESALWDTKCQKILSHQRLRDSTRSLDRRWRHAARHKEGTPVARSVHGQLTSTLLKSATDREAAPSSRRRPAWAASPDSWNPILVSSY